MFLDISKRKFSSLLEYSMIKKVQCALGKASAYELAHPEGVNPVWVTPNKRPNIESCAS